MENKREFDLEVILTVINGVIYTDDFKKVLDLTKFVYNDDSIDIADFIRLRDDLTEHLLTILESIVRGKEYFYEENVAKQVKRFTHYSINFRLCEKNWIELLKIIFGDKVGVSKKVEEELVVDNVSNDKKVRRRFFRKS